jgi:hypothetical protein
MPSGPLTQARGAGRNARPEAAGHHGGHHGGSGWAARWPSTLAHAGLDAATLGARRATGRAAPPAPSGPADAWRSCTTARTPTRADARPGSAHDFFVVVADYGGRLPGRRGRGAAAYRPGVAAALNRVLPPNVNAVVRARGQPPAAREVRELSLADVRRGLLTARHPTTRARRLFHRRSRLGADRGPRAPRSPRQWSRAVGSFAWGRPSLPPRYDAEAYCRARLGASFAAEIVPTAGPSRALVAAQRATLVPMYDALLATLAAAGAPRRRAGWPGRCRDTATPAPPPRAPARRQARTSARASAGRRPAGSSTSRSTTTGSTTWSRRWRAAAAPPSRSPSASAGGR